MAGAAISGEGGGAAISGAGVGVAPVVPASDGASLFWKRELTSITSCCVLVTGSVSILPRTLADGERMGGDAEATAGAIEGIGGFTSVSPAGTASTGPVAPASGPGVGGGGGGASSAAAGSSCSIIKPEISLSIICLMRGETASRTAFLASVAAASRSFLASMSASWNSGVDI